MTNFPPSDPQAPALPGGEVAAYRWRAFGIKSWVYDSTPEWIEDHKHEIELEALYTTPSSGPTSIPVEREDEIDRDDPRFNQGVNHVVDLLAKTIGSEDWVAGDGSEDYDEDLAQTLLNILEAKGLYDRDEGKFPALTTVSVPAEREALSAQETWAHIERLLHDECGLRMDEGLQHQRSNCINAIRNGLPDRALIRAAIEFLTRGEGLHKIRVNGKMMDRKAVATALKTNEDFVREYRHQVDNGSLTAAFAAPSPVLPPSGTDELPEWEDPRVQLVYKMLCDPDLNVPPNREEHWVGWIARNIVHGLAALTTVSVPAAQAGGVWQGIETAPKDRFILLYCPEDASRWFAKWQGGEWYGSDCEHGIRRTGHSLGDPDYVTGWFVSHWRDVPAFAPSPPAPRGD